jgi:hypothetical protein
VFTIPAHMRYRYFAATLIIALCALSVQAQSGRRRTTPPPAAPVPTPTPEPTPTPKKTDPEDELFFFMGADRNASFSTLAGGLPYGYFDAVLRGCGDRLQAGSSAVVDLTDKDFTRGEAIKRAKSETKSFVIHLTLTLDDAARSYDDLVLEFIVLAPVTAKKVAGGRSYMAGRRAGGIVVGPPTSRTGGIYREEMLRRMGEDAGERILKAMHLNVPVK